MAKLTKKQKEAIAKFDGSKVYSLEEAVDIVKKITFTKFDASVEVSVNPAFVANVLEPLSIACDFGRMR